MSEDLHIGLALGGGGAAALSSIGVVEELEEAGIRFDCVAGTSAGAIVGAALASERLPELREALMSLTRARFFKLFDPTWKRGGLMDGRRGMDLVTPYFGEQVEDLPRRFAAVATDLDTGEEVILDRGSTADAVRASIAIPGVFCPHLADGRVLVDGGLVNPIPVNVARAMGADFVVAASILRVGSPIVQIANEVLDAGTDVAEAAGAAVANTADATGTAVQLGVLDVLSKGSAVVQSHIAEARLRVDPPDVFIAPRSEHIGVFELMRSGEAIEIGREAARKALPTILEAIEVARQQHGSSPLRRLITSTLAWRRAI